MLIETSRAKGIDSKAKPKQLVYILRLVFKFSVHVYYDGLVPGRPPFSDVTVGSLDVIIASILIIFCLYRVLKPILSEVWYLQVVLCK